jgi:5'-methylthioadenosine phosphorylase
LAIQETAQIGIIGGSGLYEMEGFDEVRELALDTPFGKPSDSLMLGRLEGRPVAFLSRHARGHRILPGELNARANVFAMKQLGVEWLISVSAVGSLKEEYAPRHMVIPDQFVDRTAGRPSSFFGRGLVGHVAFAHPTSTPLRGILEAACREAGATVHTGGTLVCIEGPLFSTLAESRLYRSWGMDLVGMTALPEARLAREAEISYATLAMVTDYDCWHPEHDSVTADQIIAVLGENAVTAKAVLRAAVRRIPPPGDPLRSRCESFEALKAALVTPAHLVPDQVKAELGPIIGKYLR